MRERQHQLLKELVEFTCIVQRCLKCGWPDVFCERHARKFRELTKRAELLRKLSRNEPN